MSLKNNPFEFGFYPNLFYCMYNYSEILVEVGQISKGNHLYYFNFTPVYSPAGYHDFKSFHLLGEVNATIIMNFINDYECISCGTSFGNWGLYPTKMVQIKDYIKNSDLSCLYVWNIFSSVNAVTIPLFSRILNLARGSYYTEGSEMKILVLTTTFPRWEGDVSPPFVYELSKRLQKKGFEIVVLAPHQKGAHKFEIMDGMKVYRFPYFFPTKYQRLAYDGGILPNIKKSALAKIQIPFLFLFEFLYAYWLIKKEKINVIHSHWIIPSGLIGGFLKNFLEIRHVTTAHAGDVFTVRKSKALCVFASYVFKNSDLITANSRYTKEVIESIDNKKTENIEIIPMGVDLSKFHPGRKINLRESFNAQYLVLSVGRLVDKKGIKYLIIGMKDVIKTLPRTKLIVGGSGPEKANLRALSTELGIRDNIIFAGYIENSDLPAYYASSDVFVLPSIETKGGDTEGLGVVLLEAMACGTSVIGSDIGGITDIIIDERNGLLAMPANSEDLAHKIEKLLANEDLRLKLSREGLKTVQERFSWGLVVEDFRRSSKDSNSQTSGDAPSSRAARHARRRRIKTETG